MTIIKPYEADRFLETLSSGGHAILFHGSDTGLIAERAKTAARAFLKDHDDDPFALTRLSSSDIATDSARIADEICSIAMFNGRRCIWLQPETRDVAGILSTLTDKIAPDTLLLVEAGNLKPTSALRKLFERHGSWAAIACYADGPRDLAKLIDRMVADEGLSMDSDAKRYLLERLGGDRQASRMEIEKICLYAHGCSVISLDDVISITGDVAALEMDDMLDAMGLGEIQTLDRLVHRMLAAGTSHGQIISAAIRHFCLLHELRCDIDTGKTVRAAVESKKPPVFFKRRDAVSRQCERWSRKHIEKALFRLHEGERLSRGNDPAIAQAGVVRALLNTAAGIRR